LWDRLRQARVGAGGQPSWTIERADYVGRLSAPTAGGVSTASLTVTFTIRTVLSPTRVRLDFGSSLGAFRPLEAILDGRLVTLTWDDAGRACAIEVPRAGVHALELSLRTSVRPDGSGWQWEHPVPPVALAQVRLALPADDTAAADIASAM